MGQFENGVGFGALSRDDVQNTAPSFRRGYHTLSAAGQAKMDAEIAAQFEALQLTPAHAHLGGVPVWVIDMPYSGKQWVNTQGEVFELYNTKTDEQIAEQAAISVKKAAEKAAKAELTTQFDGIIDAAVKAIESSDLGPIYDFARYMKAQGCMVRVINKQRQVFSVALDDLKACFHAGEPITPAWLEDWADEYLLKF